MYVLILSDKENFFNKLQSVDSVKKLHFPILFLKSDF